MALSNPDKSGVLGTPNAATATINDNDQCRGISFTIASNGAVIEGGNSSFAVTKSGSSQIGSCSVNYATANGTAVAPGDYTATSGTLSFTTSQLTQTVNVPTIADGITEGAETFTASLSSPNNNGALGAGASTLVVFILVALFASLEKALASSVVFGVFLSIIQTKWDRQDRRFWITIATLAIIHIIVISLIHIPKLRFGLIILPFALADGFAMWWLINWIERRFPAVEDTDSG